MILKDSYVEPLVKSLNKLMHMLMISDVNGSNSEEINFITEVLDDIQRESRDKNVILYTRINRNNGYVSRIACGDVVYLNYDKFNNKTVQYGLNTRVGEVFELTETNIITGEKITKEVRLTGVQYTDDGNIDISFEEI